MSRHELRSTPATVATSLSRDLRPVLTIDPGDEVVVRAHDVLGHLRRFAATEGGGPRLLGDDAGLAVPGPIAVRGAEPGSTLAVRLLDVVPDDWGWTMAGWQGNQLEHRLGVAGDAPTHVVWDVDPWRGVARSEQGFEVDVAPFLGIVGLAPGEPGEHSLIPPRPTGGNLDCRELGPGATLYLPVEVPGALLLVGDGHAAQGDGEVAGTALECGTTTTMVVDLVDAPPVEGLHAQTPAGRLTFGLSPDLNEATTQALDAMVTWIQAIHGLDRPTALALASVSVSMRITQIATPVWGVHALLPTDALRRAA